MTHNPTFFLRTHRFSRRAIAACVCVLLFSLPAPQLPAAPAKAKKSAPAKTAPASYKGAIVMNASDGAVLFEDNADLVNPPASVTKLMTFLVVKEAIAAGSLSPDTPVKITAEDSKIGGTQVWLDPRETFLVEELLYGLMIKSANDCANALARATAGSRDAFVERMNARARELGMSRTTFVSPHGLPPANRRIADGDLTTPRDLATLSRHLVARTDILKYTSVRFRNFGEGQREKPVEMVNHNHLLGKVAGVDGLKTGFTNGAGFCLAATAERNGNRLIIVTMGSPDAKSRDLKISQLFETYFAKLPPRTAIAPAPRHDSPIAPAPAPQPAATTPQPAARPASGALDYKSDYKFQEPGPAPATGTAPASGTLPAIPEPFFPAPPPRK